MKLNFPIEKVIRDRYSVRNYDNKEIGLDTVNEIKSFIESLENPFGKKVNFHFLNNEQMKDQEKLGTYGVIKGARQYIGSTIKLEEMALEALGYEFEALILYLYNLDIGTCWLGGTFNRSAFSKAMNLDQDAIFPIMTPYGYIADKKHIKEIAMRKLVKADHRKEWRELFFKDDFRSVLSEEEALDFRFPLEMIRLGPSASNKQPWRVVVSDNSCHFYEYKEPKYSDRFPYDIQRIDMGIAAAHFDFAVKEKGLKGRFNTSCKHSIEVPKNIEYVFSWTRD